MIGCFRTIFAAAMLLTGQALAGLPAIEDVQQDPDRQVATVVPSDPEVRWQQYLAANRWQEGPNGHGANHFFIASGTVRVGRPFGDGWVAARNAAYRKAVILAKSAIAEWIAPTIDNHDALDFLHQGGAVAPEIVDAVDTDRQLSVIEKSERLVDAELDRLMRRYDPDWDGTGLSDAEKRRRVVAQREVIRSALKQRARFMVRGASPIFNAEGPNDLEQYTVTVGIVWSPRLVDTVERLHRASGDAVAGEPGLSVAQRIDAMLATDPNALAGFQGLRVWRDGDGNPVVVSVYAIDRQGSDAISQRRAALHARGQIATLIAEDIVSRDSTGGQHILDSYADGVTRNYDETTFHSRITATARGIELAGVRLVRTWKGKHPVSRTPMYVGVFAWSADSRDRARMLGGPPGTGRLAADSSEEGASQASAGIAGPSASRADF
jgi:hypothetical protein